MSGDNLQKEIDNFARNKKSKIGELQKALDKELKKQTEENIKIES